MSVTTVAALPGLAPLQIVTDSCAFLVRHRRRYLPLVLLLAAGLALIQPLLERFVSADIRMAIVLIAQLTVCAGLAYLWCRFVLLEDWAFDGGGVGACAPFTWTQFRGFLCYYTLICVGLLTLATVLALALAPALGIILAGLVAGLLFSLLVARLSFVLPATALQLPTSFLDSWARTTGLGLRLWSAYVGAFVPAAALMAGLTLVMTRFAGSVTVQVLASFAAWCVGMVALLAIVTMMSIAYQRTVGLPARARRLDRMVGE